MNGLSFDVFEREVFEVNHVTDEFEFIESEKPDFIIFGPYGNDLPAKGNYIRIGYFCENITPDFKTCEWAFGMPREAEFNRPNYQRIQWHDLSPQKLIKTLDDNDIDRLMSAKNSFCNFLYSHPVPYRETFFKQLSKYKKVDSPGKSMRNMPSIDQLYTGSIWERKRKFLKNYKFTIAIENYSYPGYQTEKLYDSMLVNSIPIYCGDPFIHEIFNTKSFLNAIDYIKVNNGHLVKFLEKHSQMDFLDIRPQFYTALSYRVKRKIKAVGREMKMRLQFNRLDFSNLIDQIIAIDKDPDLYKKYLKEPWFNGNFPPSNLLIKERWSDIFNQPWKP